MLQIGRSERLRKRVDAAGPEGGDGGSVVDALACCREAPEAAVETFGAIVQGGPAYVGAQLQGVLGPARRRDVVDELVVALIADDGEGAGIAENGEGDAGAAGHAHDRC